MKFVRFSCDQEGYCQVVGAVWVCYSRVMNIPANMPRLKGFRYPEEIIAFAARACHRFASSTAEVEDLRAERDVIVNREVIRLWVNRFGLSRAHCPKTAS